MNTLACAVPCRAVPCCAVLCCAALHRVGPRATAHSLEGPDSSHFLAHIFIQVSAGTVQLCWGAQACN
jgi:hypothetical protein